MYNISITQIVFRNLIQLNVFLPGCKSSSNRVPLGSRPDPKTPIPLRTMAHKRPSGNEVCRS